MHVDSTPSATKRLSMARQPSRRPSSRPGPRSGLSHAIFVSFPFRSSNPPPAPPSRRQQLEDELQQAQSTLTTLTEGLLAAARAHDLEDMLAPLVASLGLGGNAAAADGQAEDAHGSTTANGSQEHYI